MKKQIGIILGTVIIIGALIYAAIFFVNKAQELPADISSWKVIDTTDENNSAIFIMEEFPNPNISIAVPPIVKWEFQASKKSFPCVNPTTGINQSCLETTSLTLSLREKIEGVVKKYYPGYDIEFTKTDGTLDELISSVDAENKNKKIKSASKIDLNGKEAYLVVLDRTEAESKYFYSYYTINNGTKITISTYAKPTPDFLKTLSFK